MVDISVGWVKLDQNGSGPGARSSHAIAVIGQKLYTFGGEFKPRVPVDNHLYVFDLETQSWDTIPDATGDVPPPRVGVTMAAVGDVIYVFGGRDAEHKELNELYSFDTGAKKWALLSRGDVGPPHRSYHSTAADERHVYVFGGCGVAGRLNDLWAYDTAEQKWVQFPSPDFKGRGGPGLAVVQGKVWVVYGFAGQEVDDVHCFDLSTKQWAEVHTSAHKPTARSVFCTASIGKYIFIYGGEVDPSDLGHLGAGKFSGEAYALDTETSMWMKLEDGGDSNGAHHPGPRGWCAFAGGERGGKMGLLVYGGNSPSNDRLDDIYFFTPNLVE